MRDVDERRSFTSTRPLQSLYNATEGAFIWSGIGPTGNFQHGEVGAVDIDEAAQKITSKGIELNAISAKKQKTGKLSQLQITKKKPIQSVHYIW